MTSPTIPSCRRGSSAASQMARKTQSVPLIPTLLNASSTLLSICMRSLSSVLFGGSPDVFDSELSSLANSISKGNETPYEAVMAPWDASFVLKVGVMEMLEMRSGTRRLMRRRRDQDSLDGKGRLKPPHKKRDRATQIAEQTFRGGSTIPARGLLSTRVQVETNERTARWTMYLVIRVLTDLRSREKGE